MAADELQSYIRKMTGAALPIDSTGKSKGPAIILSVQAGKEKYQDWGKDDVFSIEEKGSTVSIKGNSDVAALYGAYQYLNNLGVRWFSPGETGENVPSLQQIRVGDSTRTYTPSFYKRDVGYSSTVDHHFGQDSAEATRKAAMEWELWALRNKLKFARAMHDQIRQFPENKFPVGFNAPREFVTHNIGRAALDLADYSKEPERWALVDGKRKNCKPWEAQPCLSNEKNFKAAVKAAKDYFKAHPEKVSYPLCVEDYPVWCDCPSCIKMNGGKIPSIEPNRIYWLFINRAVKEIRKEFPNRYVSVYVPYLNISVPPVDIKMSPGVLGIATNVSSGARVITHPGDERAREYYGILKGLKDAGITLGAYDYMMSTGTPQPLSVIDSARAYSDLGVVYYSPENMGRDEQHKIIDWVLAQLSWDAKQDPHRLLEDFCHEYYGAAGMDVLRVLYAIDAHVQSMEQVQWGTVGDVYLIMTPDMVEYGRRMLADAKKKVSGREAERLGMFAQTFEMYSLASQAIRSSFKAMNERTEAARAKALSDVDAFTGYWQKNNLSLTCSKAFINPNRGWLNVPGLGLEVKEMKIPAVAKAAKDLEQAKADKNSAIFIQELFSNTANVPESLPNLFMLPEVWKFRLDIDREARTGGWLSPEFDDSGWNSISTYDFYESQGYRDYGGYSVYRISVNVPSFPSGKRIYMRVGALDDKGDVYINGRLVYSRSGLEPDAWKTSFAFDVTDAVLPGEKNCFAVYCYDGFGAGGLWRPCALYTD
jgi:hypothetical protein